MDVQIRVGDCRRILADMTPGSMDCCVTSPPYYRLRDYDHPDQIGAETTPGEYVAELVDVFRGVRRILKNEGTLWLNLGDSYGKNKQLLGIPWRVAFALQDDGWKLRSEIIWDKTFHKPKRVKDRPTTAHERIFLFSKNPRYFYDAEAVAVPSASVKGRPQRARAEQIARESGLTEAHISAIRSVGITDVGKARATQSGVGKNRDQPVIRRGRPKEGRYRTHHNRKTRGVGMSEMPARSSTPRRISGRDLTLRRIAWQ